ncbi:hypothetical protein [Planotetraspora sp. GP83]|uniref:hypothetical protein n=1 Tax=Planotetraspora sp. GP83 TaxID=3156264 RepID=UPI003517725A
MDVLEATGAVAVDARVVDGDLVTGAGVTSGLDLALHLLERELGRASHTPWSDCWPMSAAASSGVPRASYLVCDAAAAGSHNGHPRLRAPEPAAGPGGIGDRRHWMKNGFL